MSAGLERKRAQHGYPHHDEVQGRSIASAVTQIDELTAALGRVRALHGECAVRCGICHTCGAQHPCPTLQATGETA
ncbi:hypothetical protein ACWFRB_09380 [Rhodococcus sp. NPDC055112]